MHVRCPHCHNPIEIVDDSSFKEIPCPACGSSFSLVGSAEETETAPMRTKMIGHFQLVEELGIGAYGTVWKANDTQLDRTVAIKIPRKDQLTEAEEEQFLREARSAAQLRHPNVVPVHEVGRDGESLYIVSDYVDGLAATTFLLVFTTLAATAWIAIQGRHHIRDMETQLELRTLAQIELLKSATTQSIPQVVETLLIEGDALHPHLREVFQHEADPNHRFRAAVALLRLGNKDTALVRNVIAHVTDAEPVEFATILAALACCRDTSLEELSYSAGIRHHTKRWPGKARLAIVGMHLGENELAADMLQFVDRSDHIQRMVFIETFSAWHGKLSDLAEQLRGTDDTALRSGMALAVGSVTGLDDEAQENWSEVFREWYTDTPDAGTHSAAGWALRSWEKELPAIPQTIRPREERDWMVTPTGLTMLRIPSGEFTLWESDFRFQKARAPNAERRQAMITADFYLSDREITSGLFRQYLNDTKPSDLETRKLLYPNDHQPAGLVSWDDSRTHRAF